MIFLDQNNLIPHDKTPLFIDPYLFIKYKFEIWT